MYILANMWFTKLIKQFFFWIDKIVYNFISSIYDLLITIARTSVLTQADIADMADRIYKLLAIFMIFKVTLSLITYVVNPDDFSDKSKGVAKLGTNIVISLAMLVLTPYIFNYAYQFQTIILEDNSLATLVFGGSTEEENSFFNTAGDDMAYITMSAFISPNLSWGDLHECASLIDSDTGKFNENCKTALMNETEDNPEFKEETLTNYIAGIENNNLGLMLRQDLILATSENDEKETEFIMDYKFIFSTVVGVVIILLLITFCMDVAVRSIKLAFLQLIAPIPILSYVDPKSGKDGLFKKWYEMCLKTFISLFVRLLALYFAVYIISKVADLKMVDLVDGSYQTNALVAIFIIIGALMFAKQLPKILEGLGIKLDGDGKFTLNPFKKFNEEALGAKAITGAAGGAVAGLVGGRGVGGRIGGLFAGAARGAIANKGFSAGLSKQADVNRKVRDARINGAGFFGTRFAGLAHTFGLEDAHLEKDAVDLKERRRKLDAAQRRVEEQTKEKRREKKTLEDSIDQPKKTAQAKMKVQSTGKSTIDFAKDEVRKNKGGAVSFEYNRRQAVEDLLKGENVGKELTEDVTLSYYDANAKKFITETYKAKDENGNPTKITTEMATKAKGSAEAYLAKHEDFEGFYNQLVTTRSNPEFNTKYSEYIRAVESLGESDVGVEKAMSSVKSQGEKLSGEADKIYEKINKTEDKISSIDSEIRKIEVDATIDGTPDGEKLEKYRDDLEKAEKEFKEKQERSTANKNSAAARSFMQNK